MKKFSLKSSASVLNRCLLTVVCILFSTSLFAQEPEYGESTGYIDAKYGIKEFLVPYTYKSTSSGNTISGTLRAYYALDSSGKPTTLLFSNIDNDTYNNYSNFCYRILYGTTRIAKGAFKNFSEFYTIYIPSTLRYFPDDLFTNHNIRFIVDDSETMVTNVSDVKDNNPQEAKEVARYNVQGIKTNKKEKGPQIIQYDDGSAKKVINKR